METPRVLDSPAFPAWDVSCPARADEVARAAVDGLFDCPLVVAAEAGPRAFVHLRWRDEVLVDVAHALVERAALLPPPLPLRAWRRCESFERMALAEHPAIGPAMSFDEMRPLMVRLEWFAATRREDVRGRLARELATAVDRLWASTPLLRGAGARIAGRLLCLRGVAAALRIVAAEGSGGGEGFLPGKQERHPRG